MPDDIAAAIAEAVAEKGQAVFDETDPAPDATQGVDMLSKSQPTNEVEAPAEGETTADVPTEYWGVPLDGIEPERRAEIIAHFEQQESVIHQLQNKLAAEPEDAPVVAPFTPAEEVSDEDLLKAMGFDPEDWESQQLAPKVLPLARTVLSLEDQVAALVQTNQVEAAKSHWNGQLDELESTHGKLPGSREQVLRFAAAEQIASPYELYFKLSTPIKGEIEKAATEARRQAAKQANSGQLKPRSSNAGADPVPAGLSLRDAVAASAKAAEKETGKSWTSIFQGRS